MLWWTAAFLLIGFLSGWYTLAQKKWVPIMAEAPPHLPKVSVIVPARNEASNLPRLLRSLKKQDCELEIIVVDDASSDGTGKLAGDLGAKVVANLDLPPGWTGKNWACYQGALVAQGELFFFVDADVFFIRTH